RGGQGVGRRAGGPARWGGGGGGGAAGGLTGAAAGGGDQADHGEQQEPGGNGGTHDVLQGPVGLAQPQLKQWARKVWGWSPLFRSAVSPRPWRPTDARSGPSATGASSP